VMEKRNGFDLKEIDQAHQKRAGKNSGRPEEIGT